MKKNPKFERGRDYGQPRQTMRGKKFAKGDRIRFKPDRSLGTVVRSSAYSLLVRWDDGDTSEVSPHEVIHSQAFGPGRKLPNPKEGVTIYTEITRIEGRKGSKSLYPGQRFYHNFKRPYPSMIGKADGSLVIRRRVK